MAALMLNLEPGDEVIMPSFALCRLLQLKSEELLGIRDRHEHCKLIAVRHWVDCKRGPRHAKARNSFQNYIRPTRLPTHADAG